MLRAVLMALIRLNQIIRQLIRLVDCRSGFALLTIALDKLMLPCGINVRSCF